MTVSIEHLQTLLQKLEDDKIKNLEAQADARRVLQEIGESTDNYPSYDKQLSEKNTYIAYILISIACDTVENNFENQIKVSDIFERASKILSDNHQYANDHENVINLNLLISSMSFYCAKQFSKAYITIGKVKTNYPVSSMINYFLKKDFDHLFSISVDLFYDAPPQSNEQEVIDRWIVSHEVARCFMIYLDTLYSGHLDRFNQIESILIILEELCQINRFVDLWLVIRLLKIIFRTFENTSIWQIIPPLMPQDSLVGRYIRLLSELKPPITELWPSQLSAVDLATGDNSGGVVNLRTSGGKTRVAEIAILKNIDWF